jgi:hypothetical protein
VGDYWFIVGFNVEPALLNEPNGLSLRVFTVPPGVDGATAPAEQRTGIEGLEETLEAEIIFGGDAQKMELELEPAFRDPGAYVGNVMPTEAGDYSFRIFGTIRGQSVDERFDSGPETFSPVEDVRQLQFPRKVALAQDLESRIGGDDGASVDDEDDESNTLPITLAVIALVGAAAGLGLGGLALARARS